MRQDVKNQWVEALRSGDFRQGRGQLHPTDGSYCCLGILCLLAEADGVCEFDKHDRACWSKSDNDSEKHTLPSCVGKWAGLDIKRVTPLIELNDAGMTFSKIADYIETKF